MPPSARGAAAPAEEHLPRDHHAEPGAVGQLDAGRVAARHGVARDLVDRRAERLEQAAERHVLAERHDPHLLVAAGDLAVGRDDHLGVDERAVARVGRELRVDRDADRERHAEPRRLGRDQRRRRRCSSNGSSSTSMPFSGHTTRSSSGLGSIVRGRVEQRLRDDAARHVERRRALRAAALHGGDGQRSRRCRSPLRRDERQQRPAARPPPSAHDAVPRRGVDRRTARCATARACERRRTPIWNTIHVSSTTPPTRATPSSGPPACEMPSVASGTPPNGKPRRIASTSVCAAGRPITRHRPGRGDRRRSGVEAAEQAGAEHVAGHGEEPHPAHADRHPGEARTGSRDRAACVRVGAAPSGRLEQRHADERERPEAPRRQRERDERRRRAATERRAASDDARGRRAAAGRRFVHGRGSDHQVGVHDDALRPSSPAGGRRTAWLSGCRSGRRSRSRRGRRSRRSVTEYACSPLASLKTISSPATSSSRWRKTLCLLVR